MEGPKAHSRYAKACQECATIKAKCARQASSLKCERCTRLNKECKARVAVARITRPPKTNRITQMEQKLDGLVSLLAASQSQESRTPVAGPCAIPTPNSLSPDTRTCEFSPIEVQFVATAPLRDSTPTRLYSNHDAHRGQVSHHSTRVVSPERNYQASSVKESLPILDIDEEQSAALLGNYQASMAKYFPFVVIPQCTTAQHLRASKPFLYLTVMAISTFHRTGEKPPLSTDIMRQLSERVLLRGEKSLDLLQGVLVYAEWYHSHQLQDPHVANILQLSIALLFDLGLNKTPYGSDKHQMVTDTTKLLHCNPAYSQVRINAERRAFLGCFYLTSTISSSFKKIDAIRYTAHAEESCDVLSQNPEYESDIFLVQLVRVQQIAEQITQTIPSDAPQSFWKSKPPIGLMIKAFEIELQSLKATLPERLRHDPSMLQHIQSCEIHLYEISLCDWSRHSHPTSTPTPNPAPATSAPSPANNNPSTTLPTARLQTLHSTLLTTSHFLTSFLTLPIHSYFSFPFPVWAQLLHAMQVMSKLSLLSGVPGWDLAYVRDVLDFSRYLQDLTERFERARREEQPQRGDEVVVGRRSCTRFEIYISRMGRIRGWFEGKVMALQQRGGVVDATAGRHGQARPDVDADMAGDVDLDVAADVYDVVLEGLNGDAVQHVGADGVAGGSSGEDGGFLMPDMIWDHIDDDAYWQDFLADWACL